MRIMRSSVAVFYLIFRYYTSIVDSHNYTGTGPLHVAAWLVAGYSLMTY